MRLVQCQMGKSASEPAAVQQPTCNSGHETGGMAGPQPPMGSPRIFLLLLEAHHIYAYTHPACHIGFYAQCQACIWCSLTCTTASWHEAAAAAATMKGSNQAHTLLCYIVTLHRFLSPLSNSAQRHTINSSEDEEHCGPQPMAQSCLILHSHALVIQHVHTAKQGTGVYIDIYRIILATSD